MIRKERMGYNPPITSVTEVRDGDPQRLKEPLRERQGDMEDPST